MEKLVVLEDDARRSNELRRVLGQSSLPLEMELFDHADELRRWLPSRLDQVAIASLDCDLDSTTAREQRDVGSGSLVADYLSHLSPMFPVLIHSSNAMRAPAMHMPLAMGGWSRLLLSPYTEADAWLEVLTRLLRR